MIFIRRFKATRGNRMALFLTVGSGRSGLTKQGKKFVALDFAIERSQHGSHAIMGLGNAANQGVVH